MIWVVLILYRIFPKKSIKLKKEVKENRGTNLIVRKRKGIFHSFSPININHIRGFGRIFSGESEIRIIGVVVVIEGPSLRNEVRGFRTLLTSIFHMSNHPNVSGIKDDVPGRVSDFRDVGLRIDGISVIRGTIIIIFYVAVSVQPAPKIFQTVIHLGTPDTIDTPNLKEANHLYMGGSPVVEKRFVEVSMDVLNLIAGNKNLKNIPVGRGVEVRRSV